MELKYIALLIGVFLFLAILVYQLILKDILHFVIATNDVSAEFKDRINKENGS